MKPLATLSLSAAFAVTSHGATLVQTGNYSFIPDGSQTLSFNRFDSNLGTLTGITITTHLTKSGGSLYIDNDAQGSASGTISQTIRIDLTSANTLLDVNFQTIGDNITALSSYSANVTGDDGDGPGYQAGGTDSDGTSFGDVSTSDTGDVNSMFFGQYTGTGTFSITVSGIQSVSTSAISGAAGSFEPATAGGSVQVTYTYTPAAPLPEPAPTLLGGIGLLLLLRRRR